MYIAQITFSSKNKDFNTNEKINDLIMSFFYSLEHNGNIVKFSFLLKQTNSSGIFQVLVPNVDSLNKKHFSEYVHSDLEKLENKSIVIRSRILRKSSTLDNYANEEVDTVENAKFLFLYTNWSDMSPPIKTSNNMNYIPLYELPVSSEDTYLTEHITFWKREYKSVDNLWIGSKPKAEKFALDQLSNPNSGLSKEGIRLCKKIQLLFNKKVFYHLFVVKSDLCPTCKSNWKLKKPVLQIFEYKCNKCLLIGTQHDF